MGQQQLLLIVLGIVITGFAVVVGLQAFAVNQKKANIDAMLITGMRIASEAQAWAQTPRSMGGGKPNFGGSSGDFTGLTIDFRQLGYTVDGGDKYVTLDGTFSITNSGGASIVIEGVSANTSGGEDDNLVCITVAGFKAEDISTALNPASGSCAAAVAT